MRRPPSGWLPARAHPVRFHASDGSGGPDAGEHVIDTSMRLEVTWRVSVGEQVYDFSEVRAAPVWVAGAGAGGGKRFYSVRLRPSGGLLAKVGVPCLVDPGNPRKLWIDWDAAFDEHEPVWEQDAAVAREVERRKPGLDGVLGRIGNPFTRKVDASEEHLVQQAIAAEAAREAEQAAHWAEVHRQRQAEQGIVPASDEEEAEQTRRLREAERIFATGREVQALVVSNVETGRTLANVPVFLITYEFDDGGGPRRAQLEYVWGPRMAKRYKPGKTTKIRIDPQDPDNVAPGA